MSKETHNETPAELVKKESLADLNPSRRNFLRSTVAVTGGAAVVAAAPVVSKAQEMTKAMDHSKMTHGDMKMEKGMLEKMHKMPISGMAREGGSDGRYVMEANSVRDKLADRCAKGSRGLVMVDNESWMKCGGKPEGWSQGPANAKPMDHSMHMMH